MSGPIIASIHLKACCLLPAIHLWNLTSPIHVPDNHSSSLSIFLFFVLLSFRFFGGSEGVCGVRGVKGEGAGRERGTSETRGDR